MGKTTKRVDFDSKGNPKIINVSKQDPDETGTIKDRGVAVRAAGRGIGKALGAASRYIGK
jgi:hypothetical protein